MRLCTVKRVFVHSVCTVKRVADRTHCVRSSTSLIKSMRYAAGIDKSLALERKIESRKRNFSLDLENLIVPISLSTLDFREWQETILFLLSIFESGKNKFSFHSRFSRVARQLSLSTLVFFSIFESSNREFNIIYSRWFKIDQPISVPEV